jgi:Ni,Fe-hydrogenase maturation factor
MERCLRIYVLGNPLLRDDSLPLRILPKLRKDEQFQNIKFIEFDPTEEFPEEEYLLIIDTIINTDKIVVLKGMEHVDKLSSHPNYSVHDFDLAFQLKLAKKMGHLKDMTIIGLPPDMEESAAFEELKRILPCAFMPN